MTSALHPYQQRMVEHLHEHPRAGLFAEPGLGKTLTVLSALTEEHLPALVVAPKRVAEHVWPTEVQKWGFPFSVQVAAGSPIKRQRALASGADIVVIGRDNVKDIPLDHDFRTIVLDELSSWKNRDTQRWKITRKITRTAEHVWGLTGTPAPNGLMDLWAQIFLLDAGERLGTSIVAFRSRYFSESRYVNGRPVEWKIKPGADVRIQGLIEDICISLKSEDYLDLPPVIHNRVEIDLPASASKAYDDLKATLVADLTLLGSTVHTAANAAVLTGKLSQVTAGFLYADETQDVTSLHRAKIEAVREIVEGTSSPVLLFFRFREEERMLREAFPEARSIDERHCIDQWNRGQVPLLLAHPASAGHGLNLQYGGGHTVIWTTPDYSLELYLQANARLHRQGQEHPVVVHHIVAPGTVDEAILEVLTEKKSVQDAVMSHLGLDPAA